MTGRSNVDADPLDRDFTDAVETGRFERVGFEFRQKDASIHLRLSSALLEASKKAAAAEGVSHQSYLRRAIERQLTASGI